jgi:sugar-specific transcriptional regulator TrmB
MVRVEHPEDDERAQELLRAVGLSAYESRCYIALIGSSTPLNGYEVAKVSGVPRSAVYESLQKLVARGAALMVSGEEGSGASFMGLPAEAFVDRLRNQLSGTLDGLASVLPAMSNVLRSSVVAHLTGRVQVRDRFISVMEKAEKSCLMAVWPPGAEEVRETARRLVKNGVQVTSLIYGEVADFPGQSHHHRFEDPLVLREVLGCRFYVVVSDMKEALVGIREGERTWGLWSDDLAVVSLTQQFVLQDITIQEMGVALEEAGLSHEVDRILKSHHQRMVQVVRQISPGSAPGSASGSAPGAAPDSAQRSPSTDPGHSRRRSV